ncbi:MAG: hypothetical protein P8P30_04300 [Rickettsiales bacterium]|nr:hypothetical protein [Rickettsiales bacterium]
MSAPKILSQDRASNFLAAIHDAAVKEGITGVNTRARLHADGEKSPPVPTLDSITEPKNRTAHFHVQYDEREVTERKNTHHSYLINDNSPDQLLYSPELGPREMQLMGKTGNEIFLAGQGEVIFSNKLNTLKNINYTVADPENIENIRLVVDAREPGGSIGFISHAMDNRVQVLSFSPEGKPTILANIILDLPEGMGIDDLKLATRDSNGFEHDVSVNKAYTTEMIESLGAKVAANASSQSLDEMITERRGDIPPPTNSSSPFRRHGWTCHANWKSAILEYDNPSHKAQNLLDCGTADDLESPSLVTRS